VRAAAKPIFWTSLGLLAYAQVGYAAVLAVATRRKSATGGASPAAAGEPLPHVSLIVAAYREEDVIAARVENLLALDYPRDRLELIVVADGSPDATPERARAAGADEVLEVPRGGKVRAQDAGVRAARGEIVAFSDANASWAPDALRRLVAPFADPGVGYVCGQVTFESPDGTNQEGLYWRYELWLREHESRLYSVTAGNGAIYATRRGAYVEVDPVMGHDLSFPFTLVKRGWRAVYAPHARAREKMTPTVDDEFDRKRRMMSHAWPILMRSGILSPRGYPPQYALAIFSHRALRYATPFLHAALLGSSAVLRRRAGLYAAALGGQLAVLFAAGLARSHPRRPLLVARYYVLTTASIAAGLLDWLRQGTDAGWEPAEGTR
jgi:cellulose synthase/poly-beta-1,6-N-acetylglucosamine synthase-like glycosyltransferase